MIERKTPQILSGFVLKLFALLFMTLDHLGLFLMARYAGVNEGLYQMAYVFRCLGRISFPLFVLMVAEGARFSRRPWMYFVRLLAMHLVISIGLSIYLYGSKNPLVSPDQIRGNAFSDLSLIALTLILFRQKNWTKFLAAIPIMVSIFFYILQTYEHANNITILWFPNYLRADYNLFGVLIGIGFYVARPLALRLSRASAEAAGIPLDMYLESKAYQQLVNIIGIAFFFAVTAIFWGVSYIGYNYDYRPFDTYLMQLQSYCLLAIPLLYLYSGKRGFDSKMVRVVTYLYYPVHIAVLFLIFSL